MVLDRKALGAIRLSLSKSVAFNIKGQETAVDFMKAQKNVKVVKETLSKLFFYFQKSKATIEKQKYEWDVNQDNSFNEGLDVAHSKGAFTRDALRVLKTNLTFKLLVVLKD